MQEDAFLGNPRDLKAFHRSLGLSIDSVYHCVKSVQIQSFFWFVFSCIPTEYGEIRSKVFGHFSRSEFVFKSCFFKDIKPNFIGTTRVKLAKKYKLRKRKIKISMIYIYFNFFFLQQNELSIFKFIFCDECSTELCNFRCLKSDHICSYSGQHFLAFEQNTEIYFVSLHIQSECGKMRTRTTLNTDTFYTGFTLLNSSITILFIYREKM